MFVLHLTLLLKKEIKTKRPISKLFGRHFIPDYAVLRSLQIDNRIQTPHAFIRSQPACGDLIVIGSSASQTDQ